MISISSTRADSVTFRLRWRGYDRAQVDQFLRQTAADRKRLQEGLARLEALMASHNQDARDREISAARREAGDIRGKARQEAEHLLRETADQAEFLQRERLHTNRREIDRLITLRSEVANCLEASIGALRTATELLAGAGGSGSEQSPPLSNVATRAPSQAASRSPRWMSSRNVSVLAVSASVCVILAAVVYRHGGQDLPSVHVAAAGQAAAAAKAFDPPAAIQAPAVLPGASRGDFKQMPSPSPPPRPDGLVVTLTALRSSWISTVIDGSQPMERLLKQDQTIMLRAQEEAVLKLHDAGALSMLINNQPAKPLGADGQVLTTRINRSNYLTFLQKDSAP